MRENIELNSFAFRGGGSSSAKFKVSTSAIFVNVYWDINFGNSPFVPYVGAGAGVSFIKSDPSHSGDGDSNRIGSSDKTDFTWNVGAGVAYKFNQNWAIDLGYRYADYGTTEANTACGWGNRSRFETDVEAHEVLLAIRYTFQPKIVSYKKAFRIFFRKAFFFSHHSFIRA